MTAQFYVPKAQAQVGRLRQRLHGLGYIWTNDVAVALEVLAATYLDCEIVHLEGLTDRTALHYLSTECNVDTSAEEPDQTPLAGGLYFTVGGLRRWIFVEATDPYTRQRFSIAHELGHLVLELEPDLERTAQLQGAMLDVSGTATVRRYARCTHRSIEESDGAVSAKGRTQGLGLTVSQPRSPWNPSDLREFDANRFAAELLMPYAAIRELIATEAGGVGVRTSADLRRIASAIATKYNVSFETAERRLARDLRIVPRSENPNADLFG